jgi:hypothetical protein
MDNIQLNEPTSLGAIVATDDIGGVQHQLIKVEFGDDGIALPVSATNPFPTEVTNTVNVTGPLTDTELRATPVPISGTVLVDTSLLATSAKQTTMDDSINTLLKPASTLAKVTTVDTITNTVNVAASSLPLPTLAATSTKQSDGTQKGQIVDGSGNVATVTGNKLDVNATLVPAGIQDVNLTKVGGSSLSIGQQLATASIPVILPAATITTLTPPAAITGFSTSANQTSGNNLLETINISVNSLLKPASTLLAVTTVSEVTAIINALPSGTNAIGKLAANSGIDIGDVDVTSIVPGTGATNLGKADNALHTSGDVGAMGLGIRNENGAILTSTDGYYAPKAMDRWGAMYISDERNNITFRGRSSTFRQLGRAGTTGAKLLAIHNATTSTVNAVIQQIAVDVMSTVIMAVTVAPVVIRIWKFTAVPTNGNSLIKNKTGGTGATNSSITLWGDSSADDTNSTTPLAITLPSGTILDATFRPRLITAVGESNDKLMRFDYVNGGGIELAPLEGLCIFLDYTLATQNPVTDKWVASIEWTEHLV